MRNKIIPLILLAFVVAFVGFISTGCSNEDDASTLEFYVTDIDPMSIYYEVAISTGGAETDVTVACKYYGDSDMAPKGMFVREIILSAQNTEGTEISAVDELTVYTGYYVDVAGTLTVTFGDIIWPSLKTWLDTQSPTGTSHMVVKILFKGEDTAGNTLNATTYFTVWYY